MENVLAVEVTQVDYERWEVTAKILLDRADAFAVVDSSSLDRAAGFVQRINDRIKEIKKTYAEPKDLAHKAHQSICALESEDLGASEQVKRIVKGKIGTWQEEQHRLRQAEQAKRQLEAQKLADDEALERAATLEADGRKVEAEAVLDTPVATPLMPAPPPPPKPEGARTRVYWKFEVTDAKLIPFEYMMPDDKKLGVYARSMQNTANVPGVRFYPERY